MPISILFYSINKKDDTSVARHFSREDHRGTDDCILHILEFINAKPEIKRAQELRDETELKWIHRLCTVYPQGMNVMDTKY